MIDIIRLHNREAEQSVLGGLMLKNNAWDDVADILTDKDFYVFEHQAIYRAMQRLAKLEQPFDWLTLSTSLEASQELETVGGDKFLVELMNGTPTAANILTYAKIVRKLALRRKLVAAANEAMAVAGNLQEEDFIDKAHKAILEVSEINTDTARFEDEYPTTTLQAIMDDFHAEENSVYIPTGLKALDELIGGVELKSYVILAARPSMGKTTLAINIADNIAKAGKSVLVFSLETTTQRLQERRLAREATVQFERIQSRKKLNSVEISNLATATHQHENMRVVIDECEKTRVTVNYIRSQCRRIKNKRGLDLVVIDYIQLMHDPDAKNEVEKITNVSRSLRALAKELNICLMVLSQLNREVEKRTEKRPMMSDLKQSGALEEDANKIIFIDRPCRHVGGENADPTLANIYVEKNKDGKTGKVDLAFLGEYCTFSNYENKGYTPPPSYMNIRKEIDLN